MTVNSIRRSPVPVARPPVSGGATPTLKLGSKGEAAKELQQLLIAKGYALTADGAFGPKTKSAVVAFQRSQGLTADGIVGPKTWAKLRETGRTTTTTTTNDVFESGRTSTNTNTHTTPTTTTPTTTTPTTSTVDNAAAARLQQARGLVRVEGSATEADRDAVARAMQSLPAGVLEAAKGKVEIVACRGSVTDYMTELKGVRPRGWPPGSTWDIVPGLYSPSKSEVVVATIDGRSGGRAVPVTGQGHGSADLVFHEMGHGLDAHGAIGGRTSTDKAFRDAYESDRTSMERHNETYLLQAGDAGPQEAFAETFARYFRRDPTLRTELPGMYAYWQKVEADLARS